MVNRNGRGTAVLVTAAVIAGLTAVVLVALGFWLRDWQRVGDGHGLSDPGWWLSLLAHLGGYLALGKGGFKVALAVVLGASGVAIWLRDRRRRSREAGAVAPEPGTDVSTSD